MISLSQLISGRPCEISEGLKLYQPALADIIDMGEERYWTLVKVWTVDRSEILIEENDQTEKLSDYDIWKRYVMTAVQLRNLVENSSLVFFRRKIEFLPSNYTIYIGDIAEGIIVNEELYLLLRKLFLQLADTSAEETPEQYKKDTKMNAKTRALIAKIEAGQKKVQEIKNREQNSVDSFGRQIVALAAIGHYTFEQVYNMTMLQFIYLLKKYVDIESFELHTIISPYISSKDSQETKHWLNT